MSYQYLYCLKRTYGDSENPQLRKLYSEALPDTLVWRDKLGYNEPFVTQYLRHPAYKNYPVVGVSWTQASDFCIWRTDRVNERILINEGILEELFASYDLAKRERERISDEGSVENPEFHELPMPMEPIHLRPMVQ